MAVAAEKDEVMAWNLNGYMIESCSCNMLCPCWFGVRELMIMDAGWCSIAQTFRVEEGNSNGLPLGGRKVVLTADFPGPTLFDGNATARLFIDDGADAEQLSELDAIFRGENGGPMGLEADLISAWLPTVTARIDIDEQDDLVVVAVEGFGTVRSQGLRDSDGKSFTLRGGGFICGLGLVEAELAPGTTEWTDVDMPRQLVTKSGARGNFAWAG
jgi:hypothetical protein